MSADKATASPLERVIGMTRWLTLRGKKFQCRQLRIRHFAEAKAFVQSLAPNPLHELVEGDGAAMFKAFPEAVQIELAKHALDLHEQRKKVTAAEAAHWINGPEGVLYLFWMMIRDTHPEYATFNALLAEFPLDDEKKELQIPEIELIQAKIDELTYGGDPETLSKKKKTKTRGTRLKKVKRKH